MDIKVEIGAATKMYETTVETFIQIMTAFLKVLEGQAKNPIEKQLSKDFAAYARSAGNILAVPDKTGSLFKMAQEEGISCLVMELNGINHLVFKDCDQVNVEKCIDQCKDLNKKNELTPSDFFDAVNNRPLVMYETEDLNNLKEVRDMISELNVPFTAIRYKDHFAIVALEENMDRIKNINLNFDKVSDADYKDFMSNTLESVLAEAEKEATEFNDKEKPKTQEQEL